MPINKSFFWIFCYLLLGLLLFFVAIFRPGTEYNLIFSALLIGAALFLGRYPDRHRYRFAFLLLACLSIVRYLCWRTVDSLALTSNLPDNMSIFLLYAAELYTLILLLLGIFTNFYPPTSIASLPLPDDQENLPSVDVLIPVYDEPIALISITLMAAISLHYPKNKFRVFLLDDGSTEEKRHHCDPLVSQKANQRYQQMATLCRKLDIHLITRADNRDAKAGNLNAALPHAQGDLLLVVDADHVLCSDFLQKTVGFFSDNPKLAIVQTPHFFINPNPIEKNLQLFDVISSENDIFYFVSQPGLNHWSASFFCGSAGLIKRAALDDVGGFCCYSVTEDCATSLQIHAKGYQSLYIDQPLISALQPETVDSYIRQRVRWTQGMIQIFLLDNPLFKKGLSVCQRIAYLNTVFFWFFPFARLVFIIMPLLFLLFGIQIYQASFGDLFSFIIPHLLIIFLTAKHLYGHVRSPFISSIYELVQAPAASLAIIKTLLFPHSPRFKATPKQEIYDKKYLSRYRYPLYILYVLSLVALILQTRYLFSPALALTNAITCLWVIINLFYLHGAIGALRELPQRRMFTRTADSRKALLKTATGLMRCQLTGLSVNGASVLLDSDVKESIDNLLSAPVTLSVLDQKGVSVIDIPANAFLRKGTNPARMILGLEFLADNNIQKEKIVLLCHGDSEKWHHILQRKHRQQPFWSISLWIAHHVFAAFADHAHLLWRTIFCRNGKR